MQGGYISFSTSKHLRKFQHKLRFYGKIILGFELHWQGCFRMTRMVTELESVGLCYVIWHTQPQDNSVSTQKICYTWKWWQAVLSIMSSHILWYLLCFGKAWIYLKFNLIITVVYLMSLSWTFCLMSFHPLWQKDVFRDKTEYFLKSSTFKAQTRVHRFKGAITK